MLQSVRINCTTTGAAGSAAVTARSSRPISGKIVALFVDWHASAPATSDITITIESDDDHPAIDVYAKTNSVTDAWVYPYVQGTTTAGVAIAGVYQPVAGEGVVKVIIAESDALTNAAIVYVYYDDLR